MKFVDDIWFESVLGTVGVIVGEDNVTHQRKAYIGIGSGTDLWKDIQTIAENGCPLTPEIASRIATLLNPLPDRSVENVDP